MATTDHQEGFSYAGLDAFKVLAQAGARTTDSFAERFGAKVVDWTRGESAFVVSYRGLHIGFVIEGLGTKNLVADAVRELQRVAQETDAWFDDGARNEDLINGWVDACKLAGCIWGPGETPGLNGIIEQGTLALSGACWGVAMGSLFNPVTITAGDSIHLLTSSGIHANGLTDARRIAGLPTVPDGYNTVLSDGRTYGESLLDRTHIYVRFIEECVDTGVRIRYGINITGHGWRKLMRAPYDFIYRMKKIPKPHPVFGFIQEKGGYSASDMYAKFNMGAGFALITHPADTHLVRRVMDEGNYPFDLIEDAGVVENGSSRKVMIEPLGITYEASELVLR